MASLIVTGRPNSELTTYCILLIQELHRCYPQINTFYVLKHPEEWNNYAEEVCKLFGFKKSSHPLVFLSNGTFIGGKDVLFSSIKRIFNIEYEADSQTIYNLTQENIKKVNQEYNMRKKGPALRDKIDSMAKILNFSEEYNTISYDYSVHYDLGLKMFYKYDLKYTPANYELYLNATDEITVEVDLTNNRIIENVEKEALNESMTAFLSGNINPNTSTLGKQQFTNNLNTSVISNKNRKMKHRKSQENISAVINESKEKNEEEDEKSEEEIKKKTFKYLYYKNYDLPKVEITPESIVERNVQYNLLNI